MSLEIALYAVAAMFGIIIMRQDVMTWKVGIIPLGCFFVACGSIFYVERNGCIFLSVILILAGSVMFLIRKAHAIGIADYIVGASISFIIPMSRIHVFFISCGIIGLTAHILLASKKIPFTPVMLTASTFTKFIEFIWD
ncbi:MAG: hypothetical protein LBJ42_01500 [Holosporales bacterium]|jgi:hypothetical protein|nr:hypothetical protein [Holosporales bacterium]